MAEDFNGPVTHFSPPLQLSLTVPDEVGDPSTVKLYTYREGVGWLDVCAEQGNSCRIADRQLNVSLSHLSDFVMVVPGGYTSVYLPVIWKKP
jgi:hypothetical protein